MHTLKQQWCACLRWTAYLALYWALPMSGLVSYLALLLKLSLWLFLHAALFDVCRHHTAWKDWLLDFQYLCSGFINCPDWCNTYNMDLSSCLVFACNIPNLCFLVLSLHYCGDSGWSLHCGQVVQEEGEKRTPSRTKICQWTTITSYLHWITAAVSVSCYCWPWLHVCVCE